MQNARNIDKAKSLDYHTDYESIGHNVSSASRCAVPRVADDEKVISRLTRPRCEAIHTLTSDNTKTRRSDVFLLLDIIKSKTSTPRT